MQAGIACAALGAATPLALARTKSIRTWEVGRFDPDNPERYALRQTQRLAPRPGPGEVVVRVRATGLNARDLTLMRGVRIWSSNESSPSRVPLDDNAGEVLELGDGVTGFAVGDRVICTHFPLWVDGPWDDATMSILDFGVNTDGFLTEQAVVPAKGLVRIPDAIPLADAATFCNAGLTAWNAVVERGQIQAGDTVVTLGSGGVSVFGLQWAKLRGARVIVTSSSDRKLKRLEELGADLTINYRRHPDWHENVLQMTTGRGADAVLNTVGISELDRCLRASASNGQVLQIGVNTVRRGDGTANSFSGLSKFPRDLVMKSLTIKAVIVGSRRMLEDLVAAAAKHNIRPIIDRVFDFDSVPDALRYYESGEKVGKVMIRVS